MFLRDTAASLVTLFNLLKDMGLINSFWARITYDNQPQVTLTQADRSR